MSGLDGVMDASEAIKVAKDVVARSVRAGRLSPGDAGTLNAAVVSLVDRRKSARVSKGVRPDGTKAAEVVLAALQSPLAKSVIADVVKDAVRGAYRQGAVDAAAEYQPWIERLAENQRDLAVQLARVEKLAAVPGGQIRSVGVDGRPRGAGRRQTPREVQLGEIADIRKQLEVAGSTVERQPLLARLREAEMVLKGIEMGGGF